MIKDSGERREFKTGAVRDIQKGKGRCDLLPLDIIIDIFRHTKSCSSPLECLSNYEDTHNPNYIEAAVVAFAGMMNWDKPQMVLELSKHYENGMEKYGIDNWKKGIPTRSYIDSGLRHYFKWLHGESDERHDVAFVWNMVCLLWTLKHKPELDDFGING